MGATGDAITTAAAAARRRRPDSKKLTDECHDKPTYPPPFLALRWQSAGESKVALPGRENLSPSERGRASSATVVPVLTGRVLGPRRCAPHRGVEIDEGEASSRDFGTNGAVLAELRPAHVGGRRVSRRPCCHLAMARVLFMRPGDCAGETGNDSVRHLASFEHQQSSRTLRRATHACTPKPAT